MDPKLLELLVCPVTKGPLTYDRDAQELISRSARLAYPVRDGIPVMLPGEARRLALIFEIRVVVVHVFSHWARAVQRQNGGDIFKSARHE